MFDWINQMVGEIVVDTLDDLAAGALIVYFCISGTGGLCR